MACEVGGNGIYLVGVSIVDRAGSHPPPKSEAGPIRVDPLTKTFGR